jgi:hypothetical protein
VTKKNAVPAALSSTTVASIKRFSAAYRLEPRTVAKSITLVVLLNAVDEKVWPRSVLLNTPPVSVAAKLASVAATNNVGGVADGSTATE